MTPLPHDNEHDHSHDTPSKEDLVRYSGIYLRAWGYTFVIIAIQLVGAFFSGSLALLADVGHVVADSFIALFPLSAAWFMRRGYPKRRVEQIAGTLAALTLLLIGFHVIDEAVSGLLAQHTQHHVEGGWLFAFALCAASVNYMQHRILSTVSPMHRHAAHSGYHFHVLTDLVKNLLLPILGIGLLLGLSEDWDLYATLAIGGLIMLRAGVLICEAWLGENIVQKVLHKTAHSLFR